MAPNKDVKCYRRPSGSSPRRRFHSECLGATAADVAGIVILHVSSLRTAAPCSGCPTRTLRRVKHAGPPTSRLGRHGDVWKLANDRAAAFLLFDKKHKRNQYQIWRCGAIKGQKSHFPSFFWVTEASGLETGENIPN